MGAVPRRELEEYANTVKPLLLDLLTQLLDKRPEDPKAFLAAYLAASAPAPAPAPEAAAPAASTTAPAPGPASASASASASAAPDSTVQEKGCGLPCQVNGFPVQSVKSRNELLAVGHLRFEVYVNELKRDNYSYVNPVEMLLEDPLDQGEACSNLFQTVKDSSLTDVEQKHGYVKPLPDQRVVSCARVHVPVPEKYTDMFSTDDASIFGNELVSDPSNFAFFSRFMVHRNFRKLRLADALFAASFAEAQARGAKIMLLNCTPALCPLYERSGFVRYKPAYYDTGGMGLQIPMALALEHADFLQKLNPTGPLTLVAMQHPKIETALSRRWLEEMQTHRAAPLVNHRCIDGSEEMLTFLQAQAEVTDLGRFDIFAGVKQNDRLHYYSKVPSALSVIDIPEGAQLTSEGDVRDECYLLLQGSMATIDHPDELLSPGVIVGEDSFLSGKARITTTVAKTGCLVMVMSRMGFLKSMNTVPEVAVKLLWNLGITLSRKFTQQSAELKESHQKLKNALESAERLAAAEVQEDEASLKRQSTASLVTQLSQAAAQLESTAQLGRQVSVANTADDMEAVWKKVQEAGFQQIQQSQLQPLQRANTVA